MTNLSGNFVIKPFNQQGVSLESQFEFSVSNWVNQGISISLQNKYLIKFDKYFNQNLD